MNVKLLELNTLILSVGDKLRQVTKNMTQANGHHLEMLSVERDTLLNEYTALCSKAATLIA